MDEAQSRIYDHFLWQAEWCERLGSPLYALLLRTLSDDLAIAGGTTWPVLRHLADDPLDSAPALRLMGAIHRMVLDGRAPELARHYPSVGGSPNDEAPEIFMWTLEGHADALIEDMKRPVQTNEVGRATALVAGFLVAARDTAMPLRLLECGASAGLNLRWDHFLYEARGQKWGPEDSPVRLCDYNSERPLPFDVEATVVERAGCDINPLDVTTEEGRSTLLSYVWPDQVQRIRLLKGAMDIARDVPVELERASAPGWAAEQLRDLPEGVATVVYHSIFFQYMRDADRTAFMEAIEEAGSRASERAPLAWLRFEPGGDQAETRMKLWPGGEDRLIATSGFHGAGARFLG